MLRKKCSLIFIFILLALILFRIKVSQESIKSFNPNSPKEVQLLSEYTVIASDDKCIGVGVVSFKIKDKLYAMGHKCDLEGLNDLSAYKMKPRFHPNSDENLGYVSIRESNNNTTNLLGRVMSNTNDGIMLQTSDNIESDMYYSIPIAGTISTGPAEILCRDETGNLQPYSVKVKIWYSLRSRELEVKLTDSRLLAKTNGILQGMSGSPIVQNGKLIGVITHVYLNNYTSGRGKVIWDINCIKNN